MNTIVEVSPAANAALDTQVLARHGSVAVYANNGGSTMELPVRPSMVPNVRWQFVLVYNAPEAWRARALEDVAAAVLDGAVRVGADAGLPLHHYPSTRRPRPTRPWRAERWARCSSTSGRSGVEAARGGGE